MNRWMMVLSGMVLSIALSSVSWAAKAPDGKPAFLKYKCTSCHSIDAAGIAKKAAEDEGETKPKKKPPDLSGVGLEKKADWIALFMQKKEKLEGELHPKKFRGTDTELKTLAAWLETMKTPKPEEKPKEKEDEKKQNEEKSDK